MVTKSKEDKRREEEKRQEKRQDGKEEKTESEMKNPQFCQVNERTKKSELVSPSIFFIESSEFKRVFNCLNESTSIFNFSGLVNEIRRGFGLHGAEKDVRGDLVPAAVKNGFIQNPRPPSAKWGRRAAPVKYKFIKIHFHQKKIFIKKPLSSKNHFHQKTTFIKKPLSPKTTFIRETNFIKNQIHQRPPPPEQKQYSPCLCESVAGRRPATPSHKHGLCPP